MSFSFSRERVLVGGQAASPLPPDCSAANRGVENPTAGRDGLEETSRGYLIPAPCPTSAPTSVISVRDTIISPGFTPQDMKWVRWDLRAHPAAAPCHEQGHCHQTRLPKPTQPLPGLSCSRLCRCSLSHCRCSVPLSQARSCSPGVPWGPGMLWDEMNEAQGKEPLTQQERAGEWELTKKIILKLSWLCSDYFTLFTKI